MTAQMKFTLGLLASICLIAGVLAIFQHRSPSPIVTIPTTPARTETAVASDWRNDVTRILSEYDQNQDARAAEQALIALHVVNQDREVDLKLVLAFHALGESRPEGKAQLAEARRLFLSTSSVVR